MGNWARAGIPALFILGTMKRVLAERDPYSGLITEWFGDGETLTERVTADPSVTKITLDANMALRNDTDHAKRGIKNEFQHAATIPAEVWLKWAEQGFDIFTAPIEEVMKKLRDPDYAYLKVTSGRI